MIPFRSSLLGSVVWSGEPGVRYRVHGESLTEEFCSKRNRAINGKQIRFESNALAKIKGDLDTAVKSGLISPEDAQPGFRQLAAVLATNEAILKCVEASSLGDWVSSAVGILSSREFVGSYGRRLDIVKRSFGKTVKTPVSVKNKN